MTRLILVLAALANEDRSQRGDVLRESDGTDSFLKPVDGDFGEAGW